MLKKRSGDSFSSSDILQQKQFLNIYSFSHLLIFALKKRACRFLYKLFKGFGNPSFRQDKLLLSRCPSTETVLEHLRIFALKKRACRFLYKLFKGFGNDLLSHPFGVVPSALRGLTSLFGMGRGGSPSLKSPLALSAI